MSTGDGGGGGASICLVPALIHLHPTPWCSKCIQWCSWLIYRRAGSCRGWRNTELGLTGHPSHNRALAATRKTQRPGKLSHRENYLTGKTISQGKLSHRELSHRPPISQQGTSCHQKDQGNYDFRTCRCRHSPTFSPSSISLPTYPDACGEFFNDRPPISQQGTSSHQKDYTTRETKISEHL